MKRFKRHASQARMVIGWTMDANKSPSKGQ